MKQQIYPPKRPNMEHFEKPKMQQLTGDFREKTGRDLIDSLNRSAMQKRVERAKAKSNGQR